MSGDQLTSASWGEALAAVPELAAAVQARFESHPHHVIATLHADGRPCLSQIRTFQ